MSSDLLWLKQRQIGIGGSDVGAIIGVNPYKTAYDVWLEKTSDIPVVTDDNPAMKAGRMLEQAVAEWFSSETGFDIITPKEANIKGKIKNWYIANVDRFVNTGKEMAVLECKTASSYAVSNWDTDIPMTYYFQLMHYLNVTGLDVGYIALLIDGRDFKYFRYEKDNDIIEMMEQDLDKFWQHVINKTPPPSQRMSDIVQKFPTDVGTEIIANDAVLTALEIIRDCKDKIKELETKLQTSEFIVKNYLEENTFLVDDSGNTLATWKASKPTKRFDSTRFKQENPEMYGKYEIESPGARRFIIKTSKRF